MRKLILGLGATLLASAAWAQTGEPVSLIPAAPSAGPAAAPAAAAAADGAAGEAAAAKKKADDQARAVKKEQDEAEDRAREQKKQADKERKASEERIEAQERATKAENERAKRAEAAAAAAPAAAVAVPAAHHAAAPAQTGDARSDATALCMHEAKTRAKTHGAEVTMREVKDTDKMSSGRVEVRASVNVITTSSKGKVSTSKKTMKCKTQHGVVTSFKID